MRAKRARRLESSAENSAPGVPGDWMGVAAGYEGCRLKRLVFLLFFDAELLDGDSSTIVSSSLISTPRLPVSPEFSSVNDL